MFSTVLGLFSQDLAVDFGTQRLRIHQRGSGLVADDAAALAVKTHRNGRRTVLGIGDEAIAMLGRTPSDIEVVEPVQQGAIRDYEALEALLLHHCRRIHGRNRLLRPRMVVAIPHQASPMERRAVRDSCESAGAREVHLVPRPLAAGRGAGLSATGHSGHLIVDLGAGRTVLSLLAMGRVIASRVLAESGRSMDAAIACWLQREHALLVGRRTAERLKHELGSLNTQREPLVGEARGRCLRTGIPRAVSLTSDDLKPLLVEHASAITMAVRELLDAAPPELAADVVDTGLVLVGGGAGTRGLPHILAHMTGLAAVCATDPELAVIRGAGAFLDSPHHHRHAALEPFTAGSLAPPSRFNG